MGGFSCSVSSFVASWSLQAKSIYTSQLTISSCRETYATTDWMLHKKKLPHKLYTIFIAYFQSTVATKPADIRQKLFRAGTLAKSWNGLDDGGAIIAANEWAIELVMPPGISLNKQIILLAINDRTLGPTEYGEMENGTSQRAMLIQQHMHRTNSNFLLAHTHTCTQTHEHLKRD